MRQTRFALALAAAVVTTIVASGCATSKRIYDGERMPRDQVAFIRPLLHDMFFFDVTSVEIVSVDGRELGLANRDAEVAAGPHTVKLSRRAGTGPATTIDLQLDAKAGHVYECESKQLSYSPPKVYFWIIDSADKSLVAGEMPPPETETDD